MMILNFIVGVATGIISGFGIGGGSLLVLYLTAVKGTAQYTAGGINLLYFIGCAPAALMGHIKNKLVKWRVAIWCALFGVAVAIPTSLCVHNFNNDWLRRLFGMILLYVGIQELRAEKKR
jgi:uncharacterized membrane protein YfcA